MSIENELKVTEQNISFAEKYQNSSIWNPYEQEQAARALVDADVMLHQLMLDKLSTEQTSIISSLLKRLDKCKNTPWPDRPI